MVLRVNVSRNNGFAVVLVVLKVMVEARSSVRYYIVQANIAVFIVVVYKVSWFV